LGALLLVGLAIAQSFGLMDRNHRVSRAWVWEGDVAGEGWVHLRNREGFIRIEEGSGSEIELVASKSWTGRRPQDVEFIANRIGNDVYICALYGGGDSSDCDEDDYDNRETNWFMQKVFRVRPVTVGFTVQVPSTARLNVDTHNGRVAVNAPLTALVANTRNGSIKTEQPVGTMEAHSRNGSITARIADGQLTGDILLETRNGSVSAELPDSVNANVILMTRNGRVSTDFPITMSGRVNTRNIEGVLGNGGPQVKLETRNGSVRLTRRSAVDVEAVAATEAVEAAAVAETP
jgi:hypothetical protein